MRVPFVQACTLALCASLLVACGSANTGAGTSVKVDALTFQNTTMPVAYAGEPFKTTVAAAGGVGPYGYRLVSGSLPPGLTMSNGTLSGTPTKLGAYSFSMEATDANLSNKVQNFTINVNELPPLSLAPTLPSGELRGETRIPLNIKAPRNVRAARVQWDLGKDVTVTRVQAENGSIVFWQQKDGLLTMDLGFRDTPRDDKRVALISVKPGAPVNLANKAFAYESRDGSGKLLSEKKLPAPPKPVPTLTPKAATPATAPAPAATSTPVAPASPATPAPASPGTVDPTKTPPPANTSETTLPSPATTAPTTPNPTPPAGTTPADPAPTPTEPATTPVTPPSSGGGQ